jgi:hypothetical protein
MKSFTAADLENLAQGRGVPGDVFRAVFADPEAVADLARLLQVRELLAPAEPDLSGRADVPAMDVSWDELARYGEGRPLDPARRAAVERFLGRHFPEALIEPSGADTQLDFHASEDTAFLPPEPRKEQGKRPDRP